MPNPTHKAIRDSIDVKSRLLNDEAFLNELDAVSNHLLDVYKRGNKLLIAGNGGSAADAQHFAGEIESQYLLTRKGRPAIALAANTSTVTAWSNDHNFDHVFGRLVEAHGQAGDALFLISTSGNSKNLIEAVRVAKEGGIKVIGLLGRDGGELKQHCDHALVVPSNETPRIQESHILCIHILCDALDQYFAAIDG